VDRSSARLSEARITEYSASIDFSAQPETSKVIIKNYASFAPLRSGGNRVSFYELC
jgi:hypothetical protein